MRRALYVANRGLLARSLTQKVMPLRSLRLFATTTSSSTPTQDASQSTRAPIFTETVTTIEEITYEIPISGAESTKAAGMDFLPGDLVGYAVGPNRTEGLIIDVFDKSFIDEFNHHHRASTTDPIAKIENYFTKQFSYHHLSNLQWYARRMELESPAGQEPASQPASSESPPQQASTQQTAPAPPGRTPEAIHFKEAQQLARSAEKVEHEVNAKLGPLNLDIAAGDIVRYRHGRNYTAGVALDIAFEPLHDEHGNFHHASKENPMAKVENLWTKKITYHHLSVLERVKRANDVESQHGRFADAEYGVYHHA